MRIVIDMQGAQTESRFRGIGRYTMSLTQAIIRNRCEHEIILALNGLFPDTIEPIRAAFDGLLAQENIHVWCAPGSVRECEIGNDCRREVAERIREAFLASLRPDVIHVSSMFEGYSDDAITSIGVFTSHIPTSAIIYDLIPLLNPELYLSTNRKYADYYHRKIGHLKKANQLLAISASSAGEGCNALEISSDAVVNISTACDKIFRPIDIPENERKKFLERFGIIQPFILYSGGLDSHKNLHRFISAYAGLPQAMCDTHQLIFVGRKHDDKVSELRRTAESLGIKNDQLIFVGYITDDELSRLYNLCTVFVLPSLHEGFGLPALEAMSCGAAVIGSNTTSIPEVIGLKDALFDPYSEESISEKMAQVLCDAAFRGMLTAHGLKQAKKFSWDESAKRAISVFEKLYSVNGYSRQKSGDENLMTQLIHAISTLVPSNISEGETLNIAYMLSCIRTASASKQFFVDVSELAQRDARTGVQRVTRSILKELLERPPEGYVVEPVYATIDEPGYRYARHFTARFLDMPCELEDEHIDYCPGDIFLGLDLQHHTIRVQARYLSLMRRDGVYVYFVVYDLLPVLFPHCWPPQHEVNKVHHEWLHVISQLDGAICISHAVADELAEWQRHHDLKRLRPFKIGWFHLGADVENSVPTGGVPDDASLVLEKLAIRPTFVMVGTIEPRKGQTQAVDAFELLWREGIDVNFVVVGKQGWMVESLVEFLRKHPELNKRLFWLEGISDEYLGKVYLSSTCLIVPSLGEGFGLPLIEAAQHNLPIIARDIPVFREVAGEYAFYFKGLEPQALADAIKQWIELNKQGKAPQSGSMPRLTWKDSTKRLLDVLANFNLSVAENVINVNWYN